jgi:hypothetical protein
MTLLNLVLKKLFAVDLVVPHRVELLNAGTFVKQNNTEFMIVSCFTMLLVHCTSRILLSLPSSNSFLQLVYVKSMATLAGGSVYAP